jgi:hypothetical protein
VTDQPSPDPIVPTPAGHFGELRGRRVIVGVPGVGFRGDLRADNPLTQDGRTFVPVLSEQDYYRSELEQIEVFAALVPIDRVWVEDVRSITPATSSALDAPAPRRPSSALQSNGLLGRRLIQRVADGFVRDLRAVSDVYPGAPGQVARVCGESDWYGWALTGKVPSCVQVDAAFLWIE